MWEGESGSRNGASLFDLQLARPSHFSPRIFLACVDGWVPRTIVMELMQCFPGLDADVVDGPYTLVSHAPTLSYGLSLSP